MFESPGALNELDDSLLEIWNDLIDAEIARQFGSGFGSRFFKRNESDVQGGSAPVQAVRWGGAPAEPNFCLGREWARKLSDWGVRGRHETHNEYCEYRTVFGVDDQGRMRPKRIEFTSELREYWVLLAQHDPDLLKNAARDVLGTTPTWNDLYGHPDPKSLNPQQRRILFGFNTAGSGYYPDMIAAGVPDQPNGSINRDNLLFMSHPINGLDDLIYVVLFGAKPYVVDEGGPTPRQAELQEIFKAFGVTHLACRNADPNAAFGAFDAVSDGKDVAFSKNLGMYIRPLNNNLFVHDGNPIPEEWIRFSRGTDGMFQRLVFGPDDGDDVFLDEVSVRRGSSLEPITGGYQVAELIEVGPLVVVGTPKPLQDSDLEFVPSDTAPISCKQADVCVRMGRLKDEYQAESTDMVRALRMMRK